MTIRSYHDDPAHATALRHLQKGEWQPGLAALTGLAKRFPNDSELAAFVAENTVRAGIDDLERQDRKRAIWRALAGWALRLALLAVIIYGGWLGLQQYTFWFNQQLAAARVVVEEQTAAFQLATKYADAQALLRAGRLHEAQTLLEELAAVDPAYPGLQMLLTQIKTLDTLAALYAEAEQYVLAENWAAALPFLETIAGADANYKNTSQYLAEAERQLLLNETLAEAEAQFEAGDWVAAAAAYEGLRAIDPAFRPDEVQQRLFDSYVRAARGALADDSDSLEALRIAEGYFRKALTLRPRDPDIKTERELARLYLQAQKDFDEARWSSAITGLEIVHSVDPGYARGAAAQTLYEARVARADAAMDAGNYEAALADYRVAVALAERDSGAVLRLYEAYLRAGEAYAAQRAFEPAVLMYRQAIEVSRLRDRAEEHPFLAESLELAEEAYTAGNYSLAYELYRASILGGDATQPETASVIHVVSAGEYLILIATRYGSTVQAIVAANDIPNPRLIYAGQELVIPVKP